MRLPSRLHADTPVMGDATDRLIALARVHVRAHTRDGHPVKAYFRGEGPLASLVKPSKPKAIPEYVMSPEGALRKNPDRSVIPDVPGPPGTHKFYRGVMLPNYGQGLDFSNSADVQKAIRADWHGYPDNYGQHWTKEKLQAEDFAVGESSSSYVWWLGDPPHDSVYGVVIEADVEQDPTDSIDPFYLRGAEDEVNPPAYANIKGLKMHVLRLLAKPDEETGTRARALEATFPVKEAATERLIGLARQHVKGYVREGEHGSVPVRPYWRSVKKMLTFELHDERKTLLASTDASSPQVANRIAQITNELRYRKEHPKREAPRPPKPGDAKYRDKPDTILWGSADEDTKARLDAALKDMEAAWPHTAPKAVLFGPNSNASMANTRFGPNEYYMELESAGGNLTPWKIQNFKNMERQGAIAHGASDDPLRYSVYHEWGHGLDGLLTGIASTTIRGEEMSPEQEAMYADMHARVAQALLDNYKDHIPAPVWMALMVEGAVTEPPVGAATFLDYHPKVRTGKGETVSAILRPLIQEDLSAYSISMSAELVAEAVAGYMTNGPGESVVSDAIVGWLADRYKEKFGVEPPLLAAVPHPVAPKPRFFNKFEGPTEGPPKYPFDWDSEDNGSGTATGTYRGLHVELIDQQFAYDAPGYHVTVFDETDVPFFEEEAPTQGAAENMIREVVQAYYDQTEHPDLTEPLTLVHTDLGDESEFAGYPLRLWRDDAGKSHWAFHDDFKGYSQEGEADDMPAAITAVKEAIGSYKMGILKQREENYKRYAKEQIESKFIRTDGKNLDLNLYEPEKYDKFIEKYDQGGGCDDIAAAVEERFGIPQVFGWYKTKDGTWEPHSWNEDNGRVVDAARYVFPGEGDSGLFTGRRGTPEVDERYSRDPEWDYSGWDEKPEGLALKTVRYEEVPYTEWPEGSVGAQIGATREIRAYDGDLQVGHLLWEDATGEILDLRVHSKRRRTGIATEMLRRAREVDPKVHHSDVLTPEGKAFANAVPWQPTPIPSLPNLDYRVSSTEQSGPFKRIMRAYNADGQAVASISWDRRSGAIWMLDVDPIYQRRGVATELLRRAREIDPQVHHSTTLTPAGKAFATAVPWKPSFTQGTGAYGMTTIEAQVDGKRVGWLGWNNDEHGTPIMEMLEVDPEYRRQGLATQLWNEAKKVVPDLQHSRERTDAGNTWAKSLGSPLPRRTKVVPAFDLKPTITQAAVGAREQATADELQKRYPETDERGWEWEYLTPGTDPYGNPTMHEIHAHDKDGHETAWIQWWDNGEIAGIRVQPSDRRKGIATEMLARAREMDPRVHHSTRLTPLGSEFAKAVPWKPTAAAHSSLAGDQYYQIGHAFAESAFKDLTDEERTATVRGWEADRDKAPYGSPTFNTMTGALAYAREQAELHTPIGRVPLKGKVTLRYTEDDRADDDRWKTRMVAAFDQDGKVVGVLEAGGARPLVTALWTHKDWRREGIAEAMHHAMNTKVGGRLVEHSDRSNAGEAWVLAEAKRGEVSPSFPTRMHKETIKDAEEAGHELSWIAQGVFDASHDSARPRFGTIFDEKGFEDVAVIQPDVPMGEPWKSSTPESWEHWSDPPTLPEILERDVPDDTWESEKVDLEPFKTLAPHQRDPAIAAAEANPKFNSLEADYKNNCFNAVAAWDARMRGYDVTALPAEVDEETGSATVTLSEWVPRWRNPNGMKVERRSQEPGLSFADSVFARVRGFEVGNYGLIWILWKHGNAHVVGWINSEDGPHVYDPQRGVEMRPDDMLWNEVADAQFIRMDDAEMDGTGLLLPVED